MHFAHVRFALVHWLLCDHCAANVATLGGRNKPERLYAFCACALCIALWDWLLATIALLMLLHWGAGVNLSASMHFAHVRFALVHWLLCDHCAADVATVGGRSKPERLCAFCACAFCVGALAICDHCAADVAALGGRSKPERLYAFCACAFCVGALATCDHCAADVAALGVNLSACMHFACVCGAFATCDHPGDALACKFNIPTATIHLADLKYIWHHKIHSAGCGVYLCPNNTFWPAYVLISRQYRV